MSWYLTATYYMDNKTDALKFHELLTESGVKHDFGGDDKGESNKVVTYSKNYHEETLIDEAYETVYPEAT